MWKVKVVFKTVNCSAQDYDGRSIDQKGFRRNGKVWERDIGCSDIIESYE